MTPLGMTILIWIDLAEATRRRNTVFYHGASRRYLPSDQLYRGGSAIFDRGAAGFTGIGSPGISKSPALVEGHGDTPMPVDAHHLVAAAPLWATMRQSTTIAASITCSLPACVSAGGLPINQHQRVSTRKVGTIFV